MKATVRMFGPRMSSLKTIVTVLVLSTLLSGCVTIGSDKALHFSASGVISAVATCLADEEQALLVGAGAGFGAGLAKEAYDSRAGGSGFSGEDLLADGLGAGVGTAIGYGLCHGQSNE